MAVSPEIPKGAKANGFATGVITSIVIATIVIALIVRMV
jgi:hypothetical protein